MSGVVHQHGPAQITVSRAARHHRPRALAVVARWTAFQAAIQSDPGVNAIASGSTSAMINGVGPAIQDLPQDQRGKIHSIAGEGLQPMVTAAEQGKFAEAGVGFPSTWIAWAAVDSLNRVFANQPQVSSGVGLRLWTVNPDRNLDSATHSYVPASDYVSNYKKIWGVR